MRKDSQIFLKKILDYRNSTGENNFELNYKYFDDIPSVETAIYDILDDLISYNCLTSKSQVIDLEGNISINLTLDGITYFDDEKEKNSAVIFNVSGGQINIAKENAKIDVIMNNIESAKDQKKKDVLVNNVYQGNEQKRRTGKKVFISYSWVPESNKEWVRKLEEKLEQDGVEVVIDYKDLRLGHDKYAFMERIVADETIDKVLLICNESYKYKADSRSGGVGEESAIITSQVYGNVRQEKFIPIVNEYDENGMPYLPNYLAARMYADLTDFNAGYEELLSNILGEDKKDGNQKIDLRNTMDIDEFDSPNPFFDYRVGKAFPGVRGVKEFNNPKECVDRLEILLRNPLNRNKKNMTDPIWWLRGSSNNEISSFERLDSERFLMDGKQLKVKKIVVYSSLAYYKKFVYVETSPEEATGLYEEMTQEQIDYWVEQIGSYYEEYAIFNGHLITRAEYDDGAAVIDGKVIDIENQACIRTRYLIPYNFIICAKWNPLNEAKHDSDVQKILYGILNGTHTIYDLVDYTEKLSRHKMDS